MHCYCLYIEKFNSSGENFHVKLLKCVISVGIRESKQAKILSDMSKSCIFFYNVNSSSKLINLGDGILVSDFAFFV